jgi:MauM/NapG family ferredoxin protein
MSNSRRDFFRQLVDKTLDQAADILEERLPVARPELPRTRLRPPGAIPEARLLETCYRCGNCVDVCPAQAIKHIKGESDEQNGTPFIEARSQPCLVCDGLECMQACPSGALQPVARQDIRMGLAVVDLAACRRSQGEDCRVCVDLCPYGEQAMRIDDSGGTVQVLSACVGCGICEWKCPERAVAVRM